MRLTAKWMYEYVSPVWDTPVGDFISSLNCESQEKIMNHLNHLKMCDHNQLPPMVRIVCENKYKGLYELRTHVKYMRVGIIFCYDGFDNIVLLHAFIKTKRTLNKSTLSTAKARRNAIANRSANTVIFSID